MNSQILKRAVGVFALLLATGCSSYGVIKNKPVSNVPDSQEYSIKAYAGSAGSQDISMMLSFSGGGTRAAAMAYGVMLELRDTMVVVNGENRRLLDEVDSISSVSGGSFTSAYYGLHGDGMFDTFEDVFLRKNVEKKLINSALNPFHWFGRKGRTERTIEYYQKQIFHGATFADMKKPGRPLIVINASDLAYGVRFSFIQEYFDLLCSDLATFPVADAVTASSAVPIVFNPVVVENLSGCSDEPFERIRQIRQLAPRQDAELDMLVGGLESYADKDRRKYIHFVDGGITDNMGLRAVYDVITLSGGAQTFMSRVGREVPEKLILITIDASTSPDYDMGSTNKQPSIAKSIGSVSGVQLHRYNTDTLAMVAGSFDKWGAQLSTPEKTVSPYFIEVSFDGIKQPEVRAFFNKVPTSFSLTDEQVDKLIEAGRELLRDHPVYQQLLADLK